MNLLKKKFLDLLFGKISIKMGMNRIIEIEDKSKRNPRKRHSVNLIKSIFSNNSGYERNIVSLNT